MLERIAVFAIAVCLAWLCASSAQSQEPSQQPVQSQSQQVEVKQPETTATQPKNPEDQRGTDQSPLIVKIAPKTDEERAEEAREKTQKQESDDDLVAYIAELADFTRWLFIATAVLAVATVFLVLATVGLLRFAYKQFRDTRRIMKFTHDEFFATHRPKIRVKHFYLARGICPEQSIVANLWCINDGNSDGILGQVGIRYHVIRAERSLPIEPKIDHIFDFIGSRLPPGVDWQIPSLDKSIDVDRVLTSSEYADIEQGRAKLYCVGWISYLDAAQRTRITGFCRVLTFPDTTIAHIGNARFRTFPDPDYEYED
jgi:hypothetical protein